jgi:acetate kinase
MKERSMSSTEIMEFLRSRVPFFQDFPSERLEDLVRQSRPADFEKGEPIIKFGEEGKFLGVLLEGEAAASYTDDGGDTHRLSVISPGDLLGEISLMTGDKTTADVYGTTRCKLLLIPHSVFLSHIITSPAAVRHLTRLVSERLRRTYSDSGRELASSAFRRSDDPYGFGLKTESPSQFLVINCGSSSIKYCLFDTADQDRNIRGIVDRIGLDGTRNIFQSLSGKHSFDLAKGDHRDAFSSIFEVLSGPEAGFLGSLEDITAVGHRFVHGGEKFNTSILITKKIMKELELLTDFAPLHNPLNLMGIREAQHFLPSAPHIAVFDTAFHHTIPSYAHLYALPYEFYEKNRIRRYGFHGMSHGYVSLRAAETLKRPFNVLQIISCHLGNGASMCAIDHGRSIDTSMGLTPTEGLIMGTRSGDLDPAVLFYIMKSENLTPEQLHEIVDKKSGLKGLSGISADIREIEMAAQAGDPRALIAIKAFCYRVRKYIGSYIAAMGGLDALVFTGGIGQGSAGVRSLACQGLANMGIRVSEDKNRSAKGFEEICDISDDESKVRVLVIPTDEELMIARETLRTLERNNITKIVRKQQKVPVPIEISAHHVHLSREHVYQLFGQSYELTPDTELSQPGQFACKEKVSLIGPKNRIDRVRILGPTRKETQVEISMTEQFILGIQPPIRQSGDLAGSPGITLEGSKGTVVIECGVICAFRHIHMSPEDALRCGLRDNCLVRVRTVGNRELVFGDVLIRVHPDFRLAMHIDTDEANAAQITAGMIGYIDEVQSKSA